MSKQLWVGAVALALWAGAARAQSMDAPFTIKTGLSPHFHLEKGDMPFYGPYKNSTLLGPGKNTATPWYMYWPAEAFQHPPQPLQFPGWPTMPPAQGATPPGQGPMPPATGWAPPAQPGPAYGQLTAQPRTPQFWPQNPAQPYPAQQQQQYPQPYPWNGFPTTTFPRAAMPTTQFPQAGVPYTGVPGYGMQPQYAPGAQGYPMPPRYPTGPALPDYTAPQPPNLPGGALWQQFRNPRP